MLNDLKGSNERKLGKKERKEMEKKEKQKEKKKEKELERKKEEMIKKEKKKKKEEKRENNIKEKNNDNPKIPKLFNKNLKSKKKSKKEYDEESSEENSKINIITSSKDGLSLINKSNIKSKSKKMKENQSENFENNIIKTYEKLSTFYKSQKNNDDMINNPQLISCLKICEKKLRNALNILKQDKNIMINRNILDKLSRLTEHDKINLNYVIGNIYMILMKRGKIFNYKSDNFEMNDLVYFINKVIQFKDILINTRNGIFYKKSLMKYLNYAMNEFELKEEQKKIINKVLEENKEMKHELILHRDFDDVVYSISEVIVKQNNSYEQYNILIKNKKMILDMIKKLNIKSRQLYNRYLEFGRILSYLFFNKSYRVYVSDQNDLEGGYKPMDIFGFTEIFFDGNKNKGEIDLINAENYLIDYDDEIEELKEKICDIIINYAIKFINLKDDFTMQYIIYTLSKRIFFSNFKKYEDISRDLLAKSLVNLCFFEDSVDLSSYFINKVLNSKDEEDKLFQSILIKQLKKFKDQKGIYTLFPNLSFLMKNKENNKIEEEKLDKEKDIINEEEEKEEEINNEKKEGENEEMSEISESQKESEYEADEEDEKTEGIQKYYKVNSEILFLLDKDLKIGFFNIQKIRQGEKFIFYEEINNSYGILDFCMYIKELDINIKIIDLTEGKVIFEMKQIDQLINCPFKLTMFFINPRILKFEIDNSFSWFTSKVIKYKTNVFYPVNPYSIGHRLLLNNYKNEILKKEKKTNKKKNKEEKIEINNNIENLIVTKIDGENKVYNCENVKNNLKEIKHMIKNKDLNIYSIFIEINEENHNSYFYYNDKEKGFVKSKLNKETFEEYIYSFISKSNINNINIINLYVINGDLEQNGNEAFMNYSKYPIKKILGFEPLIKIEGIIPKILFFIQNLNQSQLLYYIFKKKTKPEQFDKLILINYTKDCGYQLVLCNNGEIFLNPNEFKGINKNKTLEENIDILINGINTIKEEQKNFNILVTKSIDEKENLITPEKISEILNKKTENKDLIKIEQLNSDFNKEIEINSHVFYLDY